MGGDKRGNGVKGGRKTRNGNIGEEEVSRKNKEKMGQNKEKMGQKIGTKKRGDESNKGNKHITTGGKRLRKRDVTLYNPPYNAQVNANIARSFLDILDKNFPRNHKYNKILNRHTIKVAYSTTPNMERIIAGMNGAKTRGSNNIRTG